MGVGWPPGQPEAGRRETREMGLIFQGVAYYGRHSRRTRKPGRQEVCRYELGCGGRAVGYAADKVTGYPVAACERHQGL